MWQYFDLWRFLAGLGIFLFGMTFIEDGLKNLAGRSFKLFLKKSTTNPIKGIISGTIITAILQSSSVVTLMVLAFVGAGIIDLRNALGVIIGANLGTTFTGWIVATLGFKFSIDTFTLPLIAIGGIGMLFFQSRKNLLEFSRFFLGFGFLFMGLDFMKASIELFANQVDLSMFAGYTPYLFFGVGLVLTAIIQSSSASMAITLSALNAGIIPLESAAAMVIGSDLGTTVTVLLGSIKGVPSKKRVALSHLLFNLIADITALALMYPLLYLITDVFGSTDPLLTLVFFHSSFNVLGILMVLPFLGAFARFLEKRFQPKDESPSKYIKKVPTNVPDAAIAAVKSEVNHLIQLNFVLDLKVLGINSSLFSFPSGDDHSPNYELLLKQPFEEVYVTIKELEGEVVSYYLHVQNEALDDEEASLLNQSIIAVRNSMMAAKDIKDIAHNIREFERSANDSQLGLYKLIKGKLNEFLLKAHQLLMSEKPVMNFEALADMVEENRRMQELFLAETYRLVAKKQLSDVETSSLLNVNREIYQSNKYLLLAIKELILTPEQSKDLNDIPALR